MAGYEYLPVDSATGGICVCTPRGFSYFSHGVLGMSAYSVVCIGFSAFALFSCNAAFSLLSLNSIFSLLSANSMFSVASLNSKFAIGCINREFEVCF